MPLGGFESLDRLPKDFDAIYAEGSLINAPLVATQRELAALLEHLPVGGRLIMLGYPRARWEREGFLPESEWGRVTDGGAPWIEWFDLDKVMWLLQPARFEVVLYFEMHNSDYNWFDLIRVQGTSTWNRQRSLKGTTRQPISPQGADVTETNILSEIQPTQPDWDSVVDVVNGAVEVTTSTRQWAYACMFRIDPALTSDRGRYYWLAVTIAVSIGEIGIGLLRDEELIVERFPEVGKRVELFLPLTDPAPQWLVLRNTAGLSERSQATIDSVRIVSETKSSA